MLRVEELACRFPSALSFTDLVLTDGSQIRSENARLSGWVYVDILVDVKVRVVVSVQGRPRAARIGLTCGA